MKTNSNQAPDAVREQYAAFDTGALLAVLRRRFWLIAGCAAVGVLLGIAGAFTRSDVYEASATVQVEEGNSSVISIQDVSKEDIQLPETLKTVEQQLSTRNLIGRVIQANKLDEVPGFFRPGFLQRLEGRPISRGDMIDALAASFTVKLRKGTRLIDIAARHGDPKMAQTLVRSLIEQYSAQDAEWKSARFHDANKFLIDEAERLKKKLESSEHDLQQYREKNQAVSLEDKQNIIVERLKDLNLRASKAQADMLAIESDLAQIAGIGREPEKLLAIGSIANTPSVLDVRRLANEKEAAFAMLKQRYGAENPAFAQAEREWKQVKVSLDAAVLNAADSLRTSYEAARSRYEASEKMLREQEEVALDLNRKAIEYNTLSREVESNRALFEPVLKRLKETSVIENVSQIHLLVVEPPVLPEAPPWRKKLLLAVFGLLGGSAVGFGGVVVGHIMNPTIQTADHAEQMLGIPVLGAIPRVRRLKMDAGSLPGIATQRSQAAESFRFVAMANGTAAQGITLFTSPAHAQGNTFCAASHATALAQSGLRTLLIDGDMRNPGLDRVFSIPAGTAGLAECLAGRSSLGAAVVQTKVENLSVLVAGAPPQDITKLFSGPAIGALLAEAAAKFERVVVDSEAVNLASETLVLAKLAHAVCVVVEAGRTPVDAASRACRLLESAGRPPMGCILNLVPRRSIA
jgi:capsular exopolysaccharide synthesis family protein